MVVASAAPPLVLQVDGTPGWPARGTAGLGMVLRHTNGQIVRWHMARAPAATCNAAEYQALIAGLRWVLASGTRGPLWCLSDSQTVVAQLCGRARVRTGSLQPLHATAMALASQFSAITFILIPRELNRLADALAWEASCGQRSIVRALRNTNQE